MAAEVPETFASASAERDFNEEAQRLFSAMGFDGSRDVRSYHDKDKIWVDKKTHGAIYVGNETAAKGPLHEFERLQITHIVNCTDDMPNFHEGAGAGLQYMRFNVARHHHLATSPALLAEFVSELFTFVEDALHRGSGVLVHCLAGAHRAGTTGCLLLMHKEGFSVDEAVRAAQALRPIINPIGQLPLLLQRFATMREMAHDNVWKEAEAARQAQEERLRARHASRQQQRRHPPSHYADGGDGVDDGDGGDGVAAPLSQCLAVLQHIGQRADRAIASSHGLRLSLKMANGGGDGAATSAAPPAAEEVAEELEYEDDFEEFEEEEEEAAAAAAAEAAPGHPPRGNTYEEDLAMLKAAVEGSRKAVREVEERLSAAEESEPERDAYVRDPLHTPLAASIAAAIGVPLEAAERALAATGDLEKALEKLEEEGLQ